MVIVGWAVVTVRYGAGEEVHVVVSEEEEKEVGGFRMTTLT